MAITRLKRKEKRNRVKAKVRRVNIQRLNSVPVIKGVDIEKIKEEFAENLKKPAAKIEAPKVEKTAESTEAKKPKAEAKEAAPKAEKKKAAPKKKAEDN